MNQSQALQVLAVLQAAFPRFEVPAATVEVYTRSLSDFGFEEARCAVQRAVATSDRFPSISLLRESVIEERLRLPSGEEAWEQVARRSSSAPERSKCLGCQGEGTRASTSDACPSCNGVGTVAVGRTLAGPVERALDFVGGPYAVRSADHPGILRAQFLRAYAEFRAELVRAANLRSLGVLPPAAARLAAAPNGREHPPPDASILEAIASDEEVVE